jgi:hypothetical protein
MKKLLIILSVMLLLIACGNEFDDITYTVTNKSLKSVSFSFSDTTNSLNQNESVSFTINSGIGIFSPENLLFIGHKKSIELNRENLGTLGISYTFIDVTRFELEVVNTLSVPITIKADDYIDNNGEFTLAINKNDNETTYIYTSKPNFIILESFPVIIDWSINNNIIYVIIR